MPLGIYSSTAQNAGASGVVSVIPNASVEVRRESDDSLADIFSDDIGTPLSNPFFTDNAGRFEFYALGIRKGYRVTVSKGLDTRILRNQQVGDWDYLSRNINVFEFMTGAEIADVQSRTALVDVTAKILAAIAEAGTVWLPIGRYLTSAAIPITASNDSILGEHRQMTEIVSNSTTAPIITVASGLSGNSLSNFTVDRSVVPVATAHGIEAPISGGDSISRCVLSRITSRNNHHGFLLGSTDYAEFEKCISEDNYGNGVQVLQGPTVDAVQWEMRNILSQKNNGRGYSLNSVIGPTQMIVGGMTNLVSFANSSFGIIFEAATGVPIQDIRMSDSFFGSDGASEVALNTLAGSRYHTMTRVFAELAGQTATGRGLATPASAVGNGFQVLSGVEDLTLSDCLAQGNSLSGILSDANTILLNGTKTLDNGVSLTAGARYGVHIQSGRGKIVGGQSFNKAASNTQDYGIGVNVDTVSVIGVDFDGGNGNATGNIQFNGGATLEGINCIGNLPTTQQSSNPSSLILGGGAAITKHLSATAILDFPSTAAQTSSDLTIAVTGAVDGDVVVLGVQNANAPANTNYTAWVSAADTVTVRFHNYSSVAVDPVSGTFRVDVWQH